MRAPDSGTGCTWWCWFQHSRLSSGCSVSPHPDPKPRTNRILRSVLRNGVVAVSLLAVLLLSACDGDDSSQPDKKPAAKAVQLHQDPSLVRPGTPGATVVALWRYMKLGAVPLAFDLYDAKVRRDVGLQDLANTLADQETQLEGFRPVVTAVTQTRQGPLLTLKAVGADGRVLTYVYLFRRGSGSWRVRYDTFTQAALRNYVTTRHQNATKPGAKPSGSALEAGVQAAERYRLSALR